MTPEVKTAIQEIVSAFPSSPIDQVDDGTGGAFVTLHGLSLIEFPYQQSETWMGFQITHTYPYADIYPLFVRHDLSRRDGKPLGEGTSLGMFRNQPAIQISRKANHHDPATDTALLKICKVMQWLKTRS